MAIAVEKKKPLNWFNPGRPLYFSVYEMRLFYTCPGTGTMADFLEGSELQVSREGGQEVRIRFVRNGGGLKGIALRRTLGRGSLYTISKHYFEPGADWKGIEKGVNLLTYVSLNEG